MDALKIDKVVKKYKQKTVLNEVSFSVHQGEVLGLLGPNGAGKSTLMKIIAGLSRADSGDVAFFCGLTAGSPNAGKSQIGLVPQDSNLEREFTVEECLLCYARLFQVERPRRRVAEIMEYFHMTPWAKADVQFLSGGMARRALIARAMIPSPRLLLLDEPSVGLDPDMRREVWQVVSRLKADGNTIVMTTHYMEEAEFLCDRIALLKEGRLLHLDTAENLKRIAQKSKAQSAPMTLESAFLRLIDKEGA